MKYCWSPCFCRYAMRIVPPADPLLPLLSPLAPVSCPDEQAVSARAAAATSTQDLAPIERFTPMVLPPSRRGAALHQLPPSSSLIVIPVTCGGHKPRTPWCCCRRRPATRRGHPGDERHPGRRTGGA